MKVCTCWNLLTIITVRRRLRVPNKWKYLRVKPASPFNTICCKRRQYTFFAIEGVNFIITLSSIYVIGRPRGCSFYARLCCLFPRHYKINIHYYALNSDTEKPQRWDRKKIHSVTMNILTHSRGNIATNCNACAANPTRLKHIYFYEKQDQQVRIQICKYIVL